MQKIKMIGLDLDGTLLNDKKELTPYTRQVMEEAIRQGVTVLVATGRPWMGVPEFLKSFPGMDYALTSNGARIVRTQDGSVLMEQLLSRDKAKKILEICVKYDTLQEVYFDGQGYAESEVFRRITSACSSGRVAIDRESRSLDKVQALFADLDERARAWKELETLEEVEIVGSLKYNIEVNAAGVNKGSGLVELGKRLGIEREEIMAFGDGDNDEPMLREAGFGVAMANAEEKVKAAADYITGSNEEDGVAKAIERFVLEGGEVC